MNLKQELLNYNAGAQNGYAADHKAFFYFLLFTGLQGLMGRIINFFLPLYFEELGFSGVQTGIYFTFSSASLIVFSLPMGITTDKKSIAHIFMLSFLLAALSYLGFIFTRSFWVFCLFALVGSFGSQFFNTAKQSLFYKISNKESPLQAGQFQLVTLSFMGAGTILGGFLITGFSFRHAFIVAAVLNAVMIFLSRFVPKTATMAIKWSEYKLALFTPRVFFLILIFFLASLHWGAETVNLSRFLKHDLGLSITQSGLYSGTGLVFVGIGAFLGVIIVQKKIIRNLQNLLMLGYLLSGIFHVLMCVNNVYLSFAFRMVHEIGDGFAFLVLYYGIPRIFHIQTIGGCAAFISLWTSIGAITGSILFGYIGDTCGDRWPLIITGVILAFLPVLIQLRKRRELQII